MGLKIQFWEFWEDFGWISLKTILETLYDSIGTFIEASQEQPI